MGNLFFNIGQLTDYLIADSSKPVQNSGAKSGQVDFNNFLSSLTGKAGSTGSNSSNTLDNSGLASFKELSALGLNNMSLLNQTNISVNLAQNPLDYQAAYIDALLANPNSELKTQIGQLASGNQTNVQQTETLEASSITSGELMELVQNSGQPLVVELDINKVDWNAITQQQMNNSTSGNNLLSVANLTGVNMVASPSNSSAVNFSNTAQNIIDTNSLSQLQQYVKISFDMTSVKNSDATVVEIQGIDGDSGTTKINLDVNTLKNILANYKDTIKTEVKIAEIDSDITSGENNSNLSNTRNTSKSSLSNKLGIDQSKFNSTIDLGENKTENIKYSSNNNQVNAETENVPTSGKSILFDPRTLLNSDDSDSINIIVKTMNGENQNIKSETSEDNKTGFNLNTGTLTPKNNSTPISNLLPQMSAELNVNAINKNTIKSNVQIDGKQIESKGRAENNSNSNSVGVSSVSSTYNAILPVSNSLDLNGLSNANPNLTNELTSYQLGSGKTDILSTQTDFTAPAAESKTTSDAAQNIDKIIDQVQSKFHLASGSSRMTIDLKPDHLGKITIDLKYEKDTVEAVFRVDNSDVKAILNAELPKLKNDFKIDTFRVESNTTNMDNGSSASNGRNHSEKTSDYFKPYRYDDDDIESDTINASIQSKVNYYSSQRLGAIDLLA